MYQNNTTEIFLRLVTLFLSFLVLQIFSSGSAVSPSLPFVLIVFLFSCNGLFIYSSQIDISVVVVVVPTKIPFCPIK